MQTPQYPVLVVAGALRAADGRWLLQRRPQTGSLAGHWEFPGGKVDPGEDPPAALVRELAEELGIEVAIEALSPLAFATGQTGTKDNGGRPLILLLYRVAGWRGEPTALHADALGWYAADAMAQLKMPPADYPLIAALGTSDF